MKKLKASIIIAALLISAVVSAASCTSQVSMAQLSSIFNSSLEVDALDMSFNIDVTGTLLSNGKKTSIRLPKALKAGLK